MEALESALSAVPFLGHLRPDEIGRIARKFVRHNLVTGDELAFAADPAKSRFLLVVSGRARVAVERASGTRTAELIAGDGYGEVALLTGLARRTTMRAIRPTSVATLDGAGLKEVLTEFPAVALPLSNTVARDLRAEDDLVRQLLELQAEGLPREELDAAFDERRRALGRLGARVTRHSASALFQSLVTRRGGEPPFWMLMGFLVALGGARLVVGLILKYGLEKQLFALVPGTDPNPMHVHHFNYGLILIGIAGLAALTPIARRAVRALAFTFGVGAGLVFDEFGLIYNLNPEYAQRSSLISAAIVVTLLVQVTYFRSFWVALARRAWLSAKAAR